MCDTYEHNVLSLAEINNLLLSSQFRKFNLITVSGDTILMNKIFSLGLILAISLVGFQANAATITNGSFEDGHNNPATWEFLPSITGWNENVSTNVEIQRGGFIAPTAQSGNFYAELNSHPAQTGIAFELEQEFQTIANQEYKVTFWAQKRQANDGSFSASAGDSSTTVSSHAVGAWSMHQLLFTAVADLTTLRFLSLDMPEGSDTVGHFLDTVEISAVPLPGAVLLMAGGLLGLGAFRKREVASQA